MTTQQSAKNAGGPNGRIVSIDHWKAKAADDTDERAVIGALLTHPVETIDLIGGTLDPTLFVSPSCRTILAASVELLSAGSPLTTITLTQKLRDQGELESVGGTQEIARLTGEFECLPAVAEYHLGRLRNYAALRIGQELGAWLLEVSSKDGTDPSEIVAGMIERMDRIRAVQDAGDAPVTLLGALKLPTPDDGKELLRHRYLCRRGGLLLAGPTGIGKSSLGMQAAVCWALGKPCFGIAPAQPLRSLIIQAENDDGDLAEMRDGVYAGLELTAKERATADEMIALYQEDSRSGAEFFSRTVEPRLRSNRPDLLWVDPALSYIDGDSKSQEDVGRFLRNWLNPLLRRYECGAIVTHHTNKPPSGKEKTEWTGSDLAYLGSGSAEWANWARGVLAIRGLGENGIFELCLGKRGGRVGWRNEAKEPVYSALIGHAKEPGRIHWRNVDDTERPSAEKKTGRREVYSATNLLKMLGEGSKSFGEWWAQAEAQHWSKATFKRRLAEMKEDNAIIQSELDGNYSRKTIR